MPNGDLERFEREPEREVEEESRFPWGETAAGFGIGFLLWFLIHNAPGRSPSTQSRQEPQKPVEPVEPEPAPETQRTQIPPPSRNRVEKKKFDHYLLLWRPEQSEINDQPYRTYSRNYADLYYPDGTKKQIDIFSDLDPSGELFIRNVTNAINKGFQTHGKKPLLIEILERRLPENKWEMNMEDSFARGIRDSLYKTIREYEKPEDIQVFLTGKLAEDYDNLPNSIKDALKRR